MPLFKGTVKSRPGRTSLGPALHAEKLANALVAHLEALPPDAPSFRRVALRDTLFVLIKAYPELHAATQLDMERILADEKDEPWLDDSPEG